MTSIIRFCLNYFLSRQKRYALRRKSLLSLVTFPEGKRLLRSFGQAPETFDEADYLNGLGSPIEDGQSALEHFLRLGYRGGREGRFFNASEYENHYYDVAATGVDGFYHYKNYGEKEGRTGFFVSVKQALKSKSQLNYKSWLDHNQPKLEISRENATKLISRFTIKPTISIILPVYNPPLRYLKTAIESVLSQYYSHWELCIADDASKDESVRTYLTELAVSDPRIKLCFRDRNGHISQASNTALEQATGEFIALLDQDDELSPDSLFWIVDAINRNKDADLIYSDEDKIDEEGRRFDPHFKSDFNYELLLAQNMVCHLSVFRRSLVTELGGFRVGFEGAQDYDLILRVIEKSSQSKILHVPRILYHWRALKGSTAREIRSKSYAAEAGRRALEEHIQRSGQSAKVVIPDPSTAHYRVRFALNKPHPMVSILIPTRDRFELLQKCIESIALKTKYQPLEIIVIDNESTSAETLNYFTKLEAKGIRVVRSGGPFNFSKLMNAAARVASGQVLLLLNNDIEVVSADWIDEMLSFAQQASIGCVGAKLWYPNDSIQHAGIVLGIGGVAGHSHKRLAKGLRGYFNRAVSHQAVSAVTAACLMVRREVYEAVGGFDEDLPVAFNDVDFCLRVQALGYRNVFTPYAELYHHESLSRGDDTSPSQATRFKAEVDFMRKRWGKALERDPFYNPNLTLDQDDFSLAVATRVAEDADF